MASKKFSKEFLLFSGTGRLLPVRRVGAYASKNPDVGHGSTVNYITGFLSPDSYPVASLIRCDLWEGFSEFAVHQGKDGRKTRTSRLFSSLLSKRLYA